MQSVNRKILSIGLYVILFSFSSTVKAQAVQNDKVFFLEKLIANYPGYKEKIQGRKFALFLKKLENEHLQDTFKLLSKISLYFNDNHLLVFDTYYLKNLDSAQCRRNNEANIAYFNKVEKLKDNFEGYWVNDYRNCVMAIRKISQKPLVLRGYVIECRRNVLPKGSVNCEFERDEMGNFITDFVDPLWGGRFYLRSKFLNDSMLVTGGYGKWKKIKNYRYPLLDSIPAFTLKASCRKIDKNNFLISIPENSISNIKLVDSIVKANDTIIRNTQTLIIDIRNNVGGSTRTYTPLMPYIYTNPIIKASGYIYRTPEMIKEEKNSLENRRKMGDSTSVKKLEKELADLLASPTGVILSQGDTIKFNSVLSTPKQVALIVNYGCMSAAELMILDFKQSKKVKVFGERTEGAVDYLDFYSIETPSKRFSIYMPGTKRVIPPGGKKYDGIGIEPDIPIKENTPDWIDFVKKFYE